MELPGNAIGISDIMQFRECRRRWQFDMQRWSDAGEAPEAENPNNAYGSAVHLAIATCEEGRTDAEAIDVVIDRYGKWFDPEDIEQLEEDLTTYHERDYAGVKTLASEDNLKVPLMEYEGETIYYRFTLDRLYQRIEAPTSFIHIDYKSSKHRKSDDEVHKAPQLWSYNWAIYEYWPEVEDLIQIYDQLNFGKIPTRKNDDQRQKIKAWLQKQVVAILRSDHMNPKFNEWCPWCPIMMDCTEPHRVSQFAQSRIAELAPDGADVSKLAAADIETYVANLEEFETARKCISRFEDTVKDVIRELPDERRRQLGFGLFPSSRDVWSPEAMGLVAEAVGSDFYYLAKITKSNIERFYGRDKKAAERILQFAEKERQTPRLRRLKN